MFLNDKKLCVLVTHPKLCFILWITWDQGPGFNFLSQNTFCPNPNFDGIQTWPKVLFRWQKQIFPVKHGIEVLTKSPHLRKMKVVYIAFQKLVTKSELIGTYLTKSMQPEVTDARRNDQVSELLRPLKPLYHYKLTFHKNKDSRNWDESEITFRMAMIDSRTPTKPDGGL